ncbi:MAG: AMP-binding protein [Candidatus Eisenbacteria bacterium]
MTFPRGSSRAPEPVVQLLPQLLDYAATRYGSSPFLLRHAAGRWQARSFEECARAMHAFTALLEREGVRPGDHVGIQSENRPEWGLVYLAILEAGAVAVPLDAQLREQEVGEILATAGATRCVVSAQQRPVLEAVKKERLPQLALLGLDAAPDLPNWESAQREFPNEPPRPPRAEARDLAVILFTSGTTGQAKGVMLSHLNLLSNVEAVARVLEFGPGDRLLSVLPLHHTFESTGGFLCPLRVGASVAYARGLNSRELREDMSTSGATLFIGVPLLYEKLLSAIHRGIGERPLVQRTLAHALLVVSRTLRLIAGIRAGRTLLRPLREKAGLGTLRMFVCGAAPLTPEVFWGFVDLGLPVLEGYGLTETSPVACANRPQRPLPGGVGWPLPGVDVRIVDPDAEGNGEVAIRGPNVMIGYYGNPAATAEVLRDGWFYTGDLGRMLPDGRLRLTGRIKNMIATAAGKKIYPEEIELYLANCPFVLEVVVMGGRDARGEREEVHAHVYPNLPALEAHARALGKTCDGAFVESVMRQEVDARCAVLAPYKRVKRVIVRRDEFAKTTTGKIRRQDLGQEPEAKRTGAVA